MNEVRTNLKNYCRTCDLFEPVFEKDGCVSIVVCKYERVCESMRERFLKLRSHALYVCDRKECENCSFPECKHTNDIRHAVNFSYKNDGRYWEEFVEDPCSCKNSEEFPLEKERLNAEKCVKNVSKMCQNRKMEQKNEGLLDMIVLF